MEASIFHQQRENSAMLNKIMPYELDETEVEYYHKAIATDDHSGGVDMVSELILCGTMDLWVWSQPAAPNESINIIITRFVTYPDGYRELFVAMMAGTNVTDTLAHTEIHSILMSYALRKGCSRISAFVKPDMWSNFKDIVPYREEFVQIALYPEDVE